MILPAMILATLLASSAVGQPMIYSLADPTPFEISDSGLVLRGTIGSVSSEEAASWDLSTSGNDPSAAPGTHACADLSWNPSASCYIQPPFAFDLVAYRITLDPTSDPVQIVAVSFTSPTSVDYDNASYIISSDSDLRIPNGQIFVRNGGGVTFQSFSSGATPRFYLEPGETSVVLLSHFSQGDVGNALSEGSTPRFFMQEGFSGPPRGGVIDVSLVSVPEPSVRWLAAFALVLVQSISTLRRRSSGWHRSPGPAGR